MQHAESVLTFEDSNFKFKNIDRDLRAAVKLREYADEVAEKVLKRTLNEKYLGSKLLPQLSFLDPHQREGVSFILSRKRSYLAHAPGAGKTVTTLVAFLLSDCERALVIVPTGLGVQWRRQILKFYKEVSFIKPTIYVVTCKTKVNFLKVVMTDIVIIDDSVLDREPIQELIKLMKPDFVADDESSRLKEITATRSIAFYGGTAKRSGKQFRGIYKGARHVVFLDGSPMPYARPMELWTPTYALDPEAIDCLDKHDFGLRFCNAYQDRWGQWKYPGCSRPQELRRRLKERFMHVVTESELKHPERLRSLLFMDCDPRDAKQKKWERKNLKGLDLTKISERNSQGDHAKWRRQIGIKKIDWVSNYVSMRQQSQDESIIVFCWHREVAEGLVKKLSAKNIKCGLVIGGVSQKKRQKIFSDFRRKKLCVLVGNIQSIGRGTDGLQGADRAVFGEYSYSDELNKQCEKRISRKGAKRKRIPCDYVVLPNSMDEKVLVGVFAKERTTKMVIS